MLSRRTFPDVESHLGFTYIDLGRGPQPVVCAILTEQAGYCGLLPNADQMVRTHRSLLTSEHCTHTNEPCGGLCVRGKLQCNLREL